MLRVKAEQKDLDLKQWGIAIYPHSNPGSKDSLLYHQRLLDFMGKNLVRDFEHSNLEKYFTTISICGTEVKIHFY
jgi:hypothetical protein